MTMRTVYVCDRGDGTMSHMSHGTEAEARAWGVSIPGKPNWGVVTFVSLDDVCDWLTEMQADETLDWTGNAIGYVRDKLRKAVSDGS